MRRRSARALASAMLLLLVLPLQLACARLEPADGALAAAAPESTTPLLWRVSGRDADDGLFYLLGSVHVGHESMSDLGRTVADAYAACDELVVEVDLSQLSSEEIARETARHAMLPGGRTLREVLSAETYELLEARLASESTPVAAVERMQPWFVTTLLVLLEFEAAGLRGSFGVDEQFVHRASGKRPIRGLESLESQLAMMSALSPYIQELMLLDALIRSDDVEGQLRELLDSWTRGDEAALNHALLGTLEEHPELADFYDAVYFARNEAMAEQLAGLASDGTRRFVVLGAGHMIGERGIPELLAARGFRVRQIGGR